jgi:hypothetical protein
MSASARTGNKATFRRPPPIYPSFTLIMRCAWALVQMPVRVQPAPATPPATTSSTRPFPVYNPTPQRIDLTAESDDGLAMVRASTSCKSLWAGRWIFRCLSHFILLVAPTFIYSLMSAICNFVQFPSVHASIWRWNYKVPACICWRRSPGRGDRDKNFGQCSHGCDRRKSNRSRRSRR